MVLLANMLEVVDGIDVGLTLKNDVASTKPMDAVRPPVLFRVLLYTNSIIPVVSCKTILNEANALGLTAPPFPMLMLSQLISMNRNGAVPPAAN